MNNQSFRLFLTPSFHTNDKYTNDAVQFDIISSNTVQLSASLTTYPTVNGDMIADHLTRNATTSAISGSFSLIGNKLTSFEGGNDRLTNIQQYFEYLMKNAILCNITIHNQGNNSNTRFESRDNMVLTSITWTQKQASLDFNFSFTEALISTINFDDDTDIDYSNDENLPDITDPKVLSFSEVLLDWSYVDTIVLSSAYEAGIITKDFLTYYATQITFSDWTTSYFTAVGIGTIAGIAFILLGSTGPVGIAVGVVVGLAVLGIALYKLITNANAKYNYAVEQFKLYQDDRKNQEEANRLDNWLGQIHKNLKQLDNALKLYQFQATSNQQCQLYIDGEYYVFTVTASNINNKAYTETISKGPSKDLHYAYVNDTIYTTTWTLTVSKLGDSSTDEVSLYSSNGITVSGIPDIAAYAIASIDECTTRKPLFYTSNGTEVWLVSLANSNAQQLAYNECADKMKALPEVIDWTTEYDKLYAMYSKEYPNYEPWLIISITEAALKKEQEKYTKEVNDINSYNSEILSSYSKKYIDQENSKLTNYIIMTSSFSMKNYTEKLKELIDNGMKYSND